MEIKNFTDQPIRIGEFPVSLDITNIPGYHSSYGLMAMIFAYKLDSEQHFFQVRRRSDMNGLVAVFMKWEEQEGKLPEWVGDVLFDSRLVKW